MDDSHDGMGPENCHTHMHIHRDDKWVCKWCGRLHAKQTVEGGRPVHVCMCMCVY